MPLRQERGRGLAIMERPAGLQKACVAFFLHASTGHLQQACTGAPGYLLGHGSGSAVHIICCFQASLAPQAVLVDGVDRLCSPCMFQGESRRVVSLVLFGKQCMQARIRATRSTQLSLCCVLVCGHSVLKHPMRLIKLCVCTVVDNCGFGNCCSCEAIALHARLQHRTAHASCAHVHAQHCLCKVAPDLSGHVMKHHQRANFPQSCCAWLHAGFQESAYSALLQYNCSKLLCMAACRLPRISILCPAAV